MLRLIPANQLTETQKNIITDLFYDNTNLELKGIKFISFSWSSDSKCKDFAISYNNELIGMCGYSSCDDSHFSQTNYVKTYSWLDRYYRGLGLGYKVSIKLTKFIFNNEYDVEKIYKECYKENNISNSNIKKQKFKLVAEEGNVLSYCLTKKEYLETRYEYNDNTYY